jgi:serine/threonine protein phosphatase 1
LIAVGDIHGYSTTLSRLLDKIDPVEDDEFVFLGDYIDRGPDTPGVVEKCIELAASNLCSFVMGNHEEMLLASLTGKSEMQYWFKFGGADVCRQYELPQWDLTPQDIWKIDPRHMRFYGNLLDYHETDKCIFVHASYLPNMELSKTGNGALRWTKFEPSTARHFSGKRVFCGHTPGNEIRDAGHVCCIDTGCGLGGKLTAIDVNSGRVWQVSQDQPK